MGLVARLVTVTTANGRACRIAPMRRHYERSVFAAANKRAAHAGRRPRAGGGEKTMSYSKRFALVEALR
jgi:hypothetical protein